MTTDKIKLLVGETIWDFWQNQHDVEAIKKAHYVLKQEIEQGILRESKHFAEFELLCKRLGVENKLNLKL